VRSPFLAGFFLKLQALPAIMISKDLNEIGHETFRPNDLRLDFESWESLDREKLAKDFAMPSDQVLSFKNADGAMDYVEKYFKLQPLDSSTRFVGIVRTVVDEGIPEIYLVEICVRSGFIFKHTKRQLVAATLHPELYKDDPRLLRGETVTEAPEPLFRLKKGDLVYWGFDRKKHGEAAGWVLDKLTLDLDLTSGTFKISPE